MTRVTSRESVSTGGGQATGASYRPRLSADGRYVVFSSGAPDLVSGDTNPGFDVYVRDRLTGETSLASLTDAGGQATGDNDLGAISDNGQYVAFTSTSDNVVAGDTGGWRDVFLRDRSSNRTIRISIASDGAQPNQASTSPRMSADGRYVVFRSDATNLVGGDSNGKPDLFVRDRLTNLTARVSVGADNASGDVNDFTPAISRDGGVIAFSSLADTLVPGDTNAVSDVFVRAATPTVARITPRSGPTTGGTTLRIDGARFLDGTTAAIGGEAAGGGRSRGQLWVTAPASGPGFAPLTVNVPGYAPYTIPFAYTFVTPGPPGTDTDGDGMADASEAFYGLDLADPRDGTQDDDGDGMSNADEVAAGQHPRGVVKSYLAEGATSPFFTTELALVNYGESVATALLSYSTGKGTTFTQPLKVAPQSRATIDVGSVPGLDHGGVLDRARRGRAAGARPHDALGRLGLRRHSETARGSLSTTWLLAEGATHSGFDLFYLLQNPQPTETTATVTFLRPAPNPPIVQCTRCRRRAGTTSGSTSRTRGWRPPTCPRRSSRRRRSWSSGPCT